MSQGPGHHKAQELQVSAENSWTQGSGEETRAQPEEETGPRWSVPRRAGCHPGRRWAVLQPQTEMRSGGCSLGGIWDLLWVGALLNARALWAGLGCQNYEPGWAEPWETTASSSGPKQGLRKSLRGLHSVASKYEKPLLNVCICACMCAHRRVSVCTGMCVCACACMHVLTLTDTTGSSESHSRGSGRGMRGPGAPSSEAPPRAEHVSWLPPRAPPTSQARRPSSAWHTPPCPPDEATGHNTTYTPCTQSMHRSRNTLTCRLMGTSAHIHRETHTYSSSCAQVSTPTREHSRATHAQKQHKHPDTTTLVYMHLKHTYGLLRGIHIHPAPSSCTHSHTHGGNHSHAAFIHPKALTRTRGQSQLRMSPHLTQHAEVSTHRHTRVPRTAAQPGQACALTDSQTHGHTCGHPACAMPDSCTQSLACTPNTPKTCALMPCVCILCTHTHECAHSTHTPSCEPLPPPKAPGRRGAGGEAG